MKRLLSYMCAYKKESILGPLFKMLEACFELFVPLVVANMVDVGIANGSVSYVVRMGGLLLLPCNHWTDLFPDSPVLCSQGSNRNSHRTAK